MNRIKLWQDTLLALNQQLLLQQDIDAILRTIKIACLPVTQFQRINLLLANPLQQCVEIYSLEETTHELVINTSNIRPPQEQMLFWYQQKEAYYTEKTLKENFDSIAKLPQFTHMKDCWHIPLSTPNHFLGAIEFITTTSSLMGEEPGSFFNSIAQTLAGVLTNFFKFEDLKTQNTQLKQERDHFSILVDVTNTAISTLNMDDMVAKVANDIHRYFGIKFIGLALHHPLHNDQTLTIYSALFEGNQSQGQKIQALKTQNAFLQSMLQNNRLAIFKDQEHITQLQQQDVLLPVLTEKKLHNACFIPANFGNHIHGVLMLAHDTSDIFTDNHVNLLQQIADRVAVAMHNALDYEQLTAQKDKLTHENLYLAEQIQIADAFSEIVGTSPSIRKAIAQIDIVAHSNSTVLILGETGTGKELFAQAIHNRSNRHHKRMIKINCSAMPSGLLESELFGHERGAFTGAATQRKGRFELAHESTLMLDEVGDIPLEMQPKLLRVLQEKEIERLGSHKTIPVDVRLVAATNRNLKQMVEDKTYRADLYYRLNVFPIIIPPLRERKEDIPLLAQFFTRKIAKQMRKDINTIPSQAIKQLCQHDWPGNIRELANVIERAVILTKNTSLDLQLHDYSYNDTSTAAPYDNHHNLTPANYFSSTLKQPHKNESLQQGTPISTSATTELPGTTPTTIKNTPLPFHSPAQPNTPNKDVDEKYLILQALKESNGIVAGPRGAAIKLGLKRTTLLSRMQRLGINAKDAFSDDNNNI